MNPVNAMSPVPSLPRAAAPAPFTTRLLLVMAAALVPVVLTAFVTIPYNLGNHPGEPRVAAAQAPGHMT